MNRFLARRLVGGATGLGLLFATLFGSMSVSAAPADIFTRNGCAVGNYTCLRSAIGDDAFRRFYPGVPFYGYPAPVPVYTAPVPVPSYTTPYTYGYGVPAAPAVAVTVATGSTGTTAATAIVGQQVSVVAGGFTASEMVTATVTGPSGQQTVSAAVPAGSDGTVTISITFPSAGPWQVMAHGQTSNKSVSYQFNVQ